jgi:sortase A
VSRWFGTGLRRLGLYSLGVIALLAVGALALAGTGVISVAGGEPIERAIEPAETKPSTPKLVKEVAAAESTEPEKTVEQTQQEEPEKTVGQVEKAASEPDPIPDSASSSASASASAWSSASASASASARYSSASAAAPADTTMYLTVPKMGIYDIPVVEGTTEASLSQGVGHFLGSGYPWIPGSNTYIAGHRIGYPGTLSDHVFWDLPTLTVGDQISLTDANGTTYTYAVSDILEVPITDLSVTAPTGGNVVSLQTCIENYGDYWTPGPNWNVRYVVRANMV